MLPQLLLRQTKNRSQPETNGAPNAKASSLIVRKQPPKVDLSFQAKFTQPIWASNVRRENTDPRLATTAA